MIKNWLLVYLLLALPVQIIAQHGHGTMAVDKPAVHGMLVFGKEKIYASHLPLFHAPHDYQILLELELGAADKNKFTAEQKAHPEFATYTIEPEKFVLAEMIDSPKPFKVNFFRGHFERGGIKIITGVTVIIKQVIYFKKLLPDDAKDNNTKFIVFGNNKEQFAVHHISNKPDFEQIIQVKTILAKEAGKNFEMITVNESSNEPAGISGNTIETKNKTKMVLLKQLYLEFDDLKE